MDTRTYRFTLAAALRFATVRCCLCDPRNRPVGPGYTCPRGDVNRQSPLSDRHGRLGRAFDNMFSEALALVRCFCCGCAPPIWPEHDLPPRFLAWVFFAARVVLRGRLCIGLAARTLADLALALARQ